MGWWLIPISFWFFGVLIAFIPTLLPYIIRRQEEILAEDVRKTRNSDPSASTYYEMEKRGLEYTPKRAITLVTTLVSLVIIALGFVAMGFLI
jgi:hypothetical protein